MNVIHTSIIHVILLLPIFWSFFFSWVDLLFVVVLFGATSPRLGYGHLMNAECQPRSTLELVGQINGKGSSLGSIDCPD